MTNKEHWKEQAALIRRFNSGALTRVAPPVPAKTNFIETSNKISTMDKKINIYIHCYMVNHYLEVMEEILGRIQSSGLMDACHKIYIGCLGTASEQVRLTLFLEKYPKAVIAGYDANPLLYEFFTLKILKKHCDESPDKFYALYLMTKGVSYGKTHDMYVGGKFWMDYMIDWNINHWEQMYKALNMKYRGYDLCGVKVVPGRESPSSRTHFSGNWWWANSEYIQSLSRIETLNNKLRHEAEMWSTSNQPIIYMPCNLFIDYLVKGDYYEFIKNYSELNEFVL